jgi:hypothetical protein
MVQVSSRLEFSRKSYDNFNRDGSDLIGLLSFLFSIFITNSRVFSFNRVVICCFARQCKRDNIIENYKEFFR